MLKIAAFCRIINFMDNIILVSVQLPKADTSENVKVITIRMLDIMQITGASKTTSKNCIAMLAEAEFGK